MDTKNLRSRIKSVNSTLNLTKAMGLVASSKIKKANDAMRKSNEYVQSLKEILSSLLSSTECAKSPYIKRVGKRTRVIVIAGDRGLAGGYNSNVFRLASDFCGAEFIPIGKRACERFLHPPVSSEKFSAKDAQKLAYLLCDDFKENKYDRLSIISTRYISVMSQEAYVLNVFPLKYNAKTSSSVICEPNEETVFNAAVPEYLAGIITACVKESFCSEVAARRIAMDSAEKNARRMIDELTLRYNHARQDAITREITEIISGT